SRRPRSTTAVTACSTRCGNSSGCTTDRVFGEAHPMRLLTLPLYLVGNRTAILEVARSPWAVPVGFVFVLSAALAREYDGRDLRHEWGHLLLPFAASLAASFVLYLVFYAVAWWRKAEGRAFLRGYVGFLGLFWMTAPLAWLYGIPWEYLA